MADVKHTEVFDCTPEQFFDLLLDYENYPTFLNEVKSCKIVGGSDEEPLVEYHVSVIKDFKYVNKHKSQRPSEVSWEFQSGDLFKSMKGHWKLAEENGKTKEKEI